MISTATALTIAWAKRGSGPTNHQMKNVIAAMPMTAGTNHAGDFVGETLNRRAAALRLRDHLHNLREDGLAADALGLDHEATGLVRRCRR